MSSSLRDIALKLLTSNVEIEVPACPENFSEEAVDYTVKKVVWWMLKNNQEPPEKCVFHPELHDEEEATLNQVITADQQPSSYDELDRIRADSDAEGSEAGRDRKKKRSKTYIKEYFGNSMIKAEIRKPSSKITGVPGEDEFMKIFNCEAGAQDFTKDNIAGKCILCNEDVIGCQQLQNHFASKSHQSCLRNLSLDVATLQYQERVQDNCIVQDYTIQAKLKLPPSDESVNFPFSTNKCKISPAEKAAFLRSINIGDYDIPEDHAQTDAKLKLRFAEKWTNALDKKWKQSKQQEQKIVDEFKAMRTSCLDNPSSHPAHRKEWLLFWEKRRLQLIKTGTDPETHNYHPEWCRYWLPRMLELLKEEAERKIARLRVTLGMDASSLKLLFDSPVNGTVRAMPGVRALPGTRPYNNRNTNRSPVRNLSHRPHHLYNSSSPSPLPASGLPYLPSSPSPAQYRYAHNGHFSPSQQQLYYAYNDYGFYHPNLNNLYYYGYPF